MNTLSIVKCPGYKYNEYKIVLYPHDDLSQRIREIKGAFSEVINTIKIFESKQALTLVNFAQFDMMEERLINRLRTIATACRPIKVELNGFESLPSHSIFINVSSKQTIQNLSKELNAGRQLMTLNKVNKPHFLRDPHFLIAGKLLPWQYDKLWLHYDHQYFTSVFKVENFHLLKRPLGNPKKNKEKTKSFQFVNQFEFINQPALFKQGNLFSVRKSRNENHLTGDL